MVLGEIVHGPRRSQQQGSHIYWKTWKNIVHLKKSWNFAKNNKNHGNIMEFCQSGNVGTLGYCGNDIFLIRWNVYVNIDPKVFGGHIKNIHKIYLEFFEKLGKLMEISWNFVSPEMWEPCVEQFMVLGEGRINSQMVQDHSYSGLKDRHHWKHYLPSHQESHHAFWSILLPLVCGCKLAFIPSLSRVAHANPSPLQWELYSTKLRGRDTWWKPIKLSYINITKVSTTQKYVSKYVSFASCHFSTTTTRGLWL